MNHIAMQKPTKKIKSKKKLKKKSKSEEKENIIEEISDKNNDICETEKISTKKEKKVITHETILESFDNILLCIENEINALRQDSNKNKGGGSIKFLRSLNKKIKILKNQNSRILKKKPKTKRTNNKNSGFLKPVNISTEMAKFTGWDNEELKSRVDVTKYICNYIKEHNLQNPEDRRQIVPDKKLQKLLNFNPKTSKEPLRYYSLQTHLKKHFPKK